MDGVTLGSQRSEHVEEVAQTVLQVAAQRSATEADRVYPDGIVHVEAPAVNAERNVSSSSPSEPAQSRGMSKTVSKALATACNDSSVRMEHWAPRRRLRLANAFCVSLHGTSALGGADVGGDGMGDREGGGTSGDGRGRRDGGTKGGMEDGARVAGGAEK